MIPAPGTQLGIYRLTQRLGAGGMGEVWKAEDTRLHRNVAIKLLPASMTGDEESRARLLREARTAGQLYHPNIATIHGIELEGEAPYIVMEYVDGESLTQAIASRRLDETRVAEIGRGIADALAEAHAKGIVHRDVKPDNVVLAGSRVKVLDFGIAKRYGDSAQAPPGEIVTEAGVVLGTVNYMSPEQATGKPLDGRSDIFSLGVMLYQALAGRLPFQGRNNLEVLKQILRSEPPELASVAPGVSREMAAIVGRCLRKPLEERYQSADDLARDLARVALRALNDTPARPLPLPQRPWSDPDAITEVSPGPAAPLLVATPAGVSPVRPSATPASGIESGQASPSAAAGLPPAPAYAAPPATPPEPALHQASHTHWVIAGASFVVVLAIAGGFLVGKLAGSKREVRSASPTSSMPAAPTAGSASPSAAEPVPPPVSPQTVAPAAAPVAAPRPASPRPQTAPRGDTTPAEGNEAGAPATAAGSRYRLAMSSLSTGGWRYLDDEGRLTPGAEVAEGFFREMLEAEPGNASAKVNLAVIQLFRRRYDVAQKALHPLLADGSLAPQEVALASWAFSASSVAPTGNGTVEFEQALDRALLYYKNDARFVAFARDVRWLVRRGARR